MKKILLLSVLLNITLGLIILYKTSFYYNVKNFLLGKTMEELSYENRIYNDYYYKISKHYANKKSMFEILPSDSNAILLLGDSHIEGCNWNELFNDQLMLNRGIGGDNTEGVINRLDDITRNQSSKLFLKIGFNDLFFGFPISEINKNFKTILNEIIEKSPKTEIYLINLTPTLNFDKIPNSRIVELNAEIKKIADEYNLPLINTYDPFADEHGNLISKYTFDGLHLNGNGFQKLKSILEKYIYN